MIESGLRRKRVSLEMVCGRQKRLLQVGLRTAKRFPRNGLQLAETFPSGRFAADKRFPFGRLAGGKGVSSEAAERSPIGRLPNIHQGGWRPLVEGANLQGCGVDCTVCDPYSGLKSFDMSFGGSKTAEEAFKRQRRCEANGSRLSHTGLSRAADRTGRRMSEGGWLRPPTPRESL